MTNSNDYPEHDPYGQDEFFGYSGDEYAKPKRGHPTPGIDGPPMYRSFTGPAMGTLLAYILLFWVVGFVLNVVYLDQANRLKKEGAQLQNEGCLWALLIVFAIIPCGVVSIISMLPTVFALGAGT